MGSHHLLVLRGLPGSGKSRLAGQLRRSARYLVVEADALRLMLHGEQFVERLEHDVRSCEAAVVSVLLGAGHSVVVDECNFDAERVAEWRLLANSHGASFELIDMEVDIETAVRLDALRPEGKRVGPDVIGKIAAQAPKQVQTMGGQSLPNETGAQ